MWLLARVSWQYLHTVNLYIYSSDTKSAQNVFRTPVEEQVLKALNEFLQFSGGFQWLLKNAKLRE